MTQVAFNRAPTEENIIPRVLEAIEEQTGVDPREAGPPLHDVVDTDALYSLFAPMANGGNRSGGQVTFRYQEYQVVIDFNIHDGNTWIRVLDVNT